ncbi:ribosome small subunit-dependent GTPase A [Candidatus Poribacteria bacterium]|nr:MAG: ribosome small subunit-dependent GTPase A [Candidatus Poribacteria bacterium]
MFPQVNLTMEGIVIKARGGAYEVQVDKLCYTCAVRHHLIEDEKRRLAETKEMPYVDLVAVGDRVRISVPAGTEENGYIEECLPRETQFGRTRMDGWRQVIVANLEILLIIFAARHPTLKLRMLDRFLVTAEASDVEPVICINKMDLAKLENVQRELKLYEELGYKVVYTSIVTGLGVDELREAMQDKISAIVGSSGVGKSSLLNALQPGLQLRTGEVDQRIHKGRHTTTEVMLLPLEFGGFVADTPGIRTLGLLEIDDEQGLDIYFPEMRPYIPECKFAACTHQHEPVCAVKQAVETGDINPLRYESYLRISGFKEGRYERNTDKRRADRNPRRRKR